MRTWTVRAVVAVTLVLLFGSSLALAAGARAVITHGNSMEPGMTAGDLVVVLPAPSYDFGQAVAYRSALLDTVVLHRIVAREGDRFVFQGDNNDFLDPESPTQRDFVGKLALHVPQGGTWLKRLTAPPALAVYAFLLLAGGTAARTRRESKKERRTMSPRHRAAPSRVTGALPPALRPVAAVAAFLGVTGLALSALAFTRPATITLDASSTVTSSMEFGYTALVPQTPAYDGTTVTAPQPVFRALADRVDVTFTYAGPPGTLTVDAELSAASGWKGTVPLSAAQPVGEQYEGTVTLDLQQLQDRAERAGEVIGVPPSSVALAVVPTVALDGGGSFAPRLELALDDTSLSSTGELTARDETATTGTRQAPAQLSLLGRSLDVSTARTAGPLAALVAVLPALVLAAVTRLTGPASEAERIKQRYGDLVLPVMPVVLAPGRPVVDVPDVESLVKLAERYGLLVLAWSRGGVDTYVVQDEGTTFRYRSGEQSEHVAPSPSLLV